MLELKAKTREKIGKNLGALRKKGILPAVVYGYKQKNESLELDYKEFEKVYKEAGGSALIQLKIGDQARKTVLVKDVQRDPVSGNFIHVDFYAIREDQPLKIKVPVVFEGESPAVKELGGFLVKNIQEVEIEALPKDLPKELKIDISPLQTFENKLFVRDIIIPSGVSILANPEEILAFVEPPISEEELKKLEEKPEEKIEEVKTVKEVKEEKKEAPEIGTTAE